MSDRALEIIKKNELWSLIKKVALHWGEVPEFIREYAKDVVANNDMDEALICFRDLAEQTKWISPT